MKSEVLCVNDGVIFANAAAAAKYYGILPAVLSQHLNGKIKTAKGLAFARIPADALPADVVEIRRQQLNNIYRVTNISFNSDSLKYCVNDDGLQYAYFLD